MDADRLGGDTYDVRGSPFRSITQVGELSSLGSNVHDSSLIELATERLDDLAQTGRVLLDDLSNFL